MLVLATESVADIPSEQTTVSTFAVLKPPEPDEFSAWIDYTVPLFFCFIL